MQKLLFATLALSLAGTALAQIPIPAFNNTYTYTDCRGFSFTAPASFVITQLNVPNEAAQPEQCVQVALFPSAPNGTIMTTTQLFLAQNVPANTPIPCNILINQGDQVLIQGGCSNVAVSGNLYKSYTASVGGTFQTSILGIPTTLYRAGTQAPSLTGPGPFPAFGGVTGQMGRVEVWIQSPSGFASKIDFGQGCYNVADTCFYESFATGTHDLSNNNFSLLNTGSGFTAVGGLTTLYPTTNATPLALGDDTEVTVPLTSGSIPYGLNRQATALTVCSNGYVSVASGNGTGFAPVAATMLNAPHTAWWNWHDYNPAIVGSGQVKFEETTTHVYVTWDNVFSFGTTGPGNTFQFQFEKATGSVAYVYGTIDNTGNDHLVGFSEGGASADPGSMDISAALPTFSAATFAIPALALSGDVRPTIPSAVTLTVSNIPAGAPLGAVIYGLTKHFPGIDLTGFGMAGCYQFTSQDAVSLLLAPGTSASTVFNVPNSPGVAGLHVICQGAAYVPGANILGAITSNGVDLGIDVN